VIAGIGVDIVEVGRIRDVLERHGERFLARVLTDAERRYCLLHRDPAPHVAGRFAAKEAVMKALGTGWSSGVHFATIEVVRAASGQPSLRLHGAAAERAGDRAIWHLSLSHDRGQAIAVAVLERPA
jgi:holo-[acyl-carrier protein] synthase